MSSMPSDPGFDGFESHGPGLMFGFFAFVFFVLFLLAVGIAVFRVVRTRRMALDTGASSHDALALALSGTVGTAAAYVKSPTERPAEPAPRTAASRIEEVRSLQQQSLITEAQAEQRIGEILAEI
ncbi:MAG: hypothetical protein RL238_1333 [Actinomycetota bacterium]|jgi:hypothetical protein